MRGTRGNRTCLDEGALVPSSRTAAEYAPTPGCPVPHALDALRLVDECLLQRTEHVEFLASSTTFPQLTRHAARVAKLPVSVAPPREQLSLGGERKRVAHAKRHVCDEFAGDVTLNSRGKEWRHGISRRGVVAKIPIARCHEACSRLAAT